MTTSQRITIKILNKVPSLDNPWDDKLPDAKTQLLQNKYLGKKYIKYTII